MRHFNELITAYSQWRVCTEHEGEAIARGDWRGVAAQQESKTHLRETIIRSTDRARQEWKSSGRDESEFDGRVRQVVSELISLEARNADALATQRAAYTVQREELEVSRRNLQRIRASYGITPEACWQGYS